MSWLQIERDQDENLINKTLRAYPKVLAAEEIDYWIENAVGHGDPVKCQINRGPQLKVLMRLEQPKLLVEPDDHVERMDGEPAHEEEAHNDHEHFRHLNVWPRFRDERCKIYSFVSVVAK